MRKALLVIGSNQYGVVSNFFNGISKDLASLGVTTDLLDVASQETIERTAPSIEKFDVYDFIVAFNGVGLELELEGIKLKDYATDHPLFIFLVDHPIHLMKRFIGIPATVLCIDQEHVSFCQLCGFKSHFVPHAVCAENLNSDAIVSKKNKSREILFPVSYFDEQHALQKLQPVWNQISTITEQSTSVTRFLQLLGVLPLGNRPSSVALDENIRRIAVLVDHYLRAKQRNNMLSKCQEKGVKLTVIGKGSDNYAERFPLHDYEAPLNFEQLQNRIAHADFVLHNSPGFELGLHERVVIPLSVGTPVISDIKYIQKQFVNGVISLDMLQTLTEVDYEEHQQKGFKEIAEKHTWKNRWEEILNRLD